MEQDEEKLKFKKNKKNVMVVTAVQNKPYWPGANRAYSVMPLQPLHFFIFFLNLSFFHLAPCFWLTFTLKDENMNLEISHF